MCTHRRVKRRQQHIEGEKKEPGKEKGTSSLKRDTETRVKRIHQHI